MVTQVKAIPFQIEYVVHIFGVKLCKLVHNGISKAPKKKRILENSKENIKVNLGNPVQGVSPLTVIYKS